MESKQMTNKIIKRVTKAVQKRAEYWEFKNPFLKGIVTATEYRITYKGKKFSAVWKRQLITDICKSIYNIDPNFRDMREYL